MEIAGSLPRNILDLIQKAEKKRDGRRSEERVYEIKELKNMHLEVLRLAVMGVSNRDISKIINITPEMVSTILNSQVAKRQLEVMHGNRGADALSIREQISNLAPLALETLHT